MARAKNFKEFETILKRLQIPMFTVMYADREGHIMHFFGGDTPARAKGEYDWAGVAPGDTSATLWTKYHPFEELPRVVDPPSGWLQNANDPPWTTTFPPAIDPNQFPPYMAPRSMSFRAQRSARMLDEDSSITFDEMIKYKHSTRMEVADRILDDVISAARNSAGDKARRAAEVFAKWDRSADAESRGAVLFQAFRTEMVRRLGGAKMFATQWSESDPRNTPRGLADAAATIAALEKAVDQVESDYGAIDVAWGEVNRLRLAGLDLPANGAGGELGVFRVLSFVPEKDKKFRADFGDTYVAAVEFSNPVRAMAVLSYGNSSQPGSKHQADQLPLLSRKELRPVWRARAEVMKHLEERKDFK
jgi:acyl-homoserine-lactone acylase